MNATARPLTMASPLASERGRRDPLALILGHREGPDLISICVAIALFLHGGALTVVLVQNLLHDLHVAVDDGRGKLHDFFWRQYDVEVEKPKDEPKPEPPPPPPEPTPEPAPAPKAIAPKEDDPYKDAKPLPAAAAKIVTAAAPKEDEPVDLGSFTISSGNGDKLGGMQAGDGKGDKITMNRKADHDGSPNGRGTAPAAPPPPPPAENKSRPVGLPPGTGTNCPFPPEADADQVDAAIAVVQITVRPDGSVLSATVVTDPGHGFGRAARLCAMGWRATPALNAAGEAIVQSVPVNVRFKR